LRVESPFIAKSVIENLDAWLMQLRPSSDDALSLQLSYGVIGFGSVGESILTELRERGVNASVYDLNHNRRAAAARLGLNVALSLDELLDGAVLHLTLDAAPTSSWHKRHFPHIGPMPPTDNVMTRRLWIDSS
jgi:phosphoglycerate dehydrogenase-like enzyme